MTQKDYLMLFENEIKLMHGLTSRKNADYAEDNDAFANFKLVVKVTNGRISAIDGVLVRMTDKLKRVGSLLARKAKVEDESILDTLSDLAVYSIILKLMLQEKMKTNSMIDKTAVKKLKRAALRPHV